VAALIKAETGQDTELIEGGRGEFTVWVGDDVVSKKTTFGFPEDADAVAAVKKALGSA
jgi:hypothetical protein